MWLTANRNCSPWTTFCNHNLILFPNIRFRICRLKSKIITQRSFLCRFPKIHNLHLNLDNFDQSVKVQKFHTVWILQNQSNFSVKYKNETVQVGPDDARASNVLPVAIRFRLNKTNQSRIIEFCISFIFSSNTINFGIHMGDNDVGDFMTVTDLRCWWQNHYVGDFFRYVGDFQISMY